jgi:mannose-1-phosphate guanylyltransferase
MRHGVILAGGGGTRLWPASRRQRPKQFLHLTDGGESLLAATARRLAPSCDDRLVVVTAVEQVEQVRETLPGLSESGIVAEPAGRNTAAALGLAAAVLCHRDPDAVMAAIPSDQHIRDEAGFRAVLATAFGAAESHDAIVTIGIVPSRPETGYGYMKVSAQESGQLRRVDAFVEKPDLATAEGYLASGDYLWNAGMFICRARHLLDEIREHLPETAAGLERIAATLGGSPQELEDVCREVYPTLPRVSIDVGVMEKSRAVMTVPGDFGWNDVGAWNALADVHSADASGNVIAGQAVAHDATNNIIVGDPDKLVAVAGVDELIVVQSGDAVLVVPRDRAQDVRAIVGELEKSGLERFL